MRFKNIFLVLFGFLALSFPLLPTPVRASDLCDGVLITDTQKVVSVRFTMPNVNAGEERCFAISKDQQSLTYQDFLTAKLPVKDMGGNDIEIEAQSCTDKGEWHSVSKSTLRNSTLSLTPTCAYFEAQDSSPGHMQAPLLVWKARSQGDGRFPASGYSNAYARLKILVGGSARYINLLGIEEQTATDKEIVNTCRQILFQQIPQCNNNSSEAQKLITAISVNQAFPLLQSISTQIGKDCEGAFRKCVADVGKGLEPGTVDDTHANDPRYQKPADYSGPLPDCAFSYEGCRNINDVLQFLIKIGKILFEAIGSVAFVMFIYGGFTMILSMGNSEKVKKGQEILVAAVIGIIIAFGAYLMIDFVLNTLQVSDEFRAVNTTPQAKTK